MQNMPENQRLPIGDIRVSIRSPCAVWRANNPGTRRDYVDETATGVDRHRFLTSVDVVAVTEHRDTRKRQTPVISLLSGAVRELIAGLHRDGRR
jgi:hypothetical protein